MELYKLREGTLTVECLPEPAWNGSYDIIVVGMGTAGAQCAYTASSRYSMRVLGIEESTELGGMATSGEITEYYCGNKGGLYQEVDRAAQKLEQEAGFFPNSQGISGWAKNLALQTRLAEGPVTLLYDTVISGVWRKGNCVQGVTVQDGQMRELTFRGNYVIDCTGDGIVCAMAGCAMEERSQTLFPFQPFSNIRVVLGEQGIHCCNVDSGYIDPHDPWQYGKAILSSSALPNFYLEDYSKGELLLYNAPVLGVRECRRILGEETVTFDGILTDTPPKHPAFYCFSNIDNHCRATAFESQLYQLWIAVAGLWNVYIQFPVPMEALIPKGVQGILAAGRCIAADHDAACALRMKDEMYKSGETAACMAWLSIQQGIPAKNVPYSLLRQELLQTGCLRNGEHSSFRYGPRGGPLKEIIWKREAGSLYRELSSSKPGIALWSLYQSQQGRSVAARGLVSPDKRERYHSAMALALLKDRRCIPVLREMLWDQTGDAPQTSQMFAHPYPILAILLAGYLPAPELAEELLTLAQNPHLETVALVPNDLCQDTTDLEFQYFTHCMAALAYIGQHEPALQERIQDILRVQLSKQKFWLSLGGTKLCVNEHLARWLKSHA